MEENNEETKAGEEAGEKSGAETEAGKEKPKDGGNAGGKPSTPQAIIDANAAAERIEKVTAALKKENDRIENAEIRKSLGGDTEAGGNRIEKTADEKWAEDAKTRYAGTGMDPTPDNTPTTFS